MHKLRIFAKEATQWLVQATPISAWRVYLATVNPTTDEASKDRHPWRFLFHLLAGAASDSDSLASSGAINVRGCARARLNVVRVQCFLLCL